jgi:hypothetical protein
MFHLLGALFYVISFLVVKRFFDAGRRLTQAVGLAILMWHG